MPPTRAAVVEAEVDLRAYVRRLRSAQADPTGGDVGQTAADVERSIAVSALRLCRRANEAAMAQLMGGDDRYPWSPWRLFVAAPRRQVDEALRMLKVAEVALDDASVRDVLARRLAQVGHEFAAASSAADCMAVPTTEASLFAQHWPYVVTRFNTAAVLHSAGMFRRAALVSDEAMTLLASTGCEPDRLVHCAMAATENAARVGQQLVVGILSHACITRSTVVHHDEFRGGGGRRGGPSPAVAAAAAASIPPSRPAAANATSRALADRLKAAETTAGLAVTLARHLDSFVVAHAAVQLEVRDHFLDDSGFPTGADRGFSFASAVRGVWPGALVGSSSVPILLACTHYNLGVIASDVPKRYDVAEASLRAAHRYAETAFGYDHAFPRLVRERLQGLAKKSAALRGSGTTGLAAPGSLVSHMPLSTLRGAHALQTQRRAASGHRAAGSLAPRLRQPVAGVAGHASRVLLTGTHGTDNFVNESWVERSHDDDALREGGVGAPPSVPSSVDRTSVLYQYFGHPRDR